jgi:hypothetical protein
VVLDWMGQWVTEKLKPKYPGLGAVQFKDAWRMDVPFHLDAPPTIFSYTHGLAKSTSWGCQLIAHGHDSFIVAFDAEGRRHGEFEALAKAYLNHAYLYNVKHLKSPGVIGYQSMTRGQMEIRFPAGAQWPDLIAMDDEPTIENIASMLQHNFLPTLELRKPLDSFYVSEGSNKGAYVELN